MFKRVKAWFGNQKVRNKIIAVYIPLIIVPLFTLGYVSNRISTQAVVDKTVKNVTNNSSLIITRIDVMIRNFESCANMLTINLGNVISQYRGANESSVVDLQLANQVRSQLDFARMMFPEVDSAAFIDIYDRIYSTNSNLEASLEQTRNNDMIAEINSSNGVNKWFPMQVRGYLTINDRDPLLTLGKKVINRNSGQTLGVLVLNLRESTISSVYKSSKPIKSGEYFITDSQGLVVSSIVPEELLRPIGNATLLDWVVKSTNTSEIKKVNGKDTLVTKIPFDNMGWYLVSKVPIAELTAENRQISLIIVLIGILCLIVALAGAGVLSGVIVSPINKLKKGMLKIKEGDLDIQFDVRTTDEIGLFAESFNTMIQRIKELLERVRLEQKKKREFELALFQMQIKPHFLYNTLDTINSLAKMGRLEEVSSATIALADFYRMALSKGKEIITVKEEVKSINAYLSIQRIRYSDVFDFEINVADDITENSILKLTIQPLVENSIYHGLKTKEGFGRITINGFRQEDRIIIKVIDDGVGIEEDKLRTLLETGPSGRQEQNSFGIKSVDERIKMYFGEKYGLEITSEVGRGTEVTVSIPAGKGVN